MKDIIFILLRVLILLPIMVVAYIPWCILVYGLMGIIPILLIVYLIIYPFTFIMKDKVREDIWEGIEILSGFMFITPFHEFKSIIINGSIENK